MAEPMKKSPGKECCEQELRFSFLEPPQSSLRHQGKNTWSAEVHMRIKLRYIIYKSKYP